MNQEFEFPNQALYLLYPPAMFLGMTLESTCLLFGSIAFATNARSCRPGHAAAEGAMLNVN